MSLISRPVDPNIIVKRVYKQGTRKDRGKDIWIKIIERAQRTVKI